MSTNEVPAIRNVGRIKPDEIAEALTRAPFAYAHGAAQVFTPDGRTTYTENGSPTFGEWGVNDQGQFWSFWPPTYRANYDVFWVKDAGSIVGVRFIDLDHAGTSEGRYSPGLDSGPE